MFGSWPTLLGCREECVDRLHDCLSTHMRYFRPHWRPIWAIVVNSISNQDMPEKNLSYVSHKIQLWQVRHDSSGLFLSFDTQVDCKKLLQFVSLWYIKNSLFSHTNLTQNYLSCNLSNANENVNRVCKRSRLLKTTQYCTYKWPWSSGHSDRQRE